MEGKRWAWEKGREGKGRNLIVQIWLTMQIQISGFLWFFFISTYLDIDTCPCLQNTKCGRNRRKNRAKGILLVSRIPSKSFYQTNLIVIWLNNTYSLLVHSWVKPSIFPGSLELKDRKSGNPFWKTADIVKSTPRREAAGEAIDGGQWTSWVFKSERPGFPFHQQLPRHLTWVEKLTKQTYCTHKMNPRTSQGYREESMRQPWRCYLPGLQQPFNKPSWHQWESNIFKRKI